MKLLICTVWIYKLKMLGFTWSNERLPLTFQSDETERVGEMLPECWGTVNFESFARDTEGIILCPLYLALKWI